MNKDEIENRLNHTKNILHKCGLEGKININLMISDIEYLLNEIKNLEDENKILKDVFYQIRDLSSPYIVWYDYFTNCYNLKGCTKQEIYRNFSKIRKIVYGNYTLLYNNEALKQLIKDKIKEKSNE